MIKEDVAADGHCSCGYMPMRKTTQSAEQEIDYSQGLFQLYFWKI